MSFFERSVREFSKRGFGVVIYELDLPWIAEECEPMTALEATGRMGSSVDTKWVCIFPEGHVVVARLFRGSYE